MELQLSEDSSACKHVRCQAIAGCHRDRVIVGGVSDCPGNCPHQVGVLKIPPLLIAEARLARSSNHAS